MNDTLAIFLVILIIVGGWLLIGLILTSLITAIISLPGWWRGDGDIVIDLTDEATRGMIGCGPLIIPGFVIIGLLWVLFKALDYIPPVKWPKPVFRIPARKLRT